MLNTNNCSVMDCTAGCGTLTTTTTPASTFAGDYVNVTAQPAVNYYQSYPYNNYFPTYTVWPQNDARIASLEGEVKVLREMVAALLTGREITKPRAPRAK